MMQQNIISPPPIANLNLNGVEGIIESMKWTGSLLLFPVLSSGRQGVSKKLNLKKYIGTMCTESKIAQ